MSIIFPTKSPVDRFGPSLIAPASDPGRLRKIARRLRSLLDSKETLDRVYSNGYFENHYPEADRTLKNGLHDQTMQAWADAQNDSERGEEEGEATTLQVVININK